MEEQSIEEMKEEIIEMLNSMTNEEYKGFIDYVKEKDPEIYNMLFVKKKLS